MPTAKDIQAHELILDLLHVWAEETPDEKLRKEAQTLLFGLKSAQAS